MSGVGDSWLDDSMDGADWSFLGSDTGSSPGIVPVPPGAPQTPALIPVSLQDASAALMSRVAYAPPPALQDPNAGMPPSASTPNAEGVASALKYSGWGQDAATLFARQIGRLGSGDRTVLNNLESTARRYLTGPLAAGEALAGTMSDIHQGASPLDATMGNFVRGGLVYGAGVGGGSVSDGFGAIPATWLADRYLPPAPQIGHAIVQGILGPPLLYDPSSFEAYGE